MNKILFPDVHSSLTSEESQFLDKCTRYKEFEEFINQKYLNALDLSLKSDNQIAVYLITGGNVGYSFSDAIVQVTSNLLCAYHWEEVNKNIVQSRTIKGRIDWQKVIAVMKQDGSTPDDNFKSKNFQDHSGRNITAYAISENDRAWVKILSGSNRLSVHRLHHLMVELINRKS